MKFTLKDIFRTESFGILLCYRVYSNKCEKSDPYKMMNRRILLCVNNRMVKVPTDYNSSGTRFGDSCGRTRRRYRGFIKEKKLSGRECWLVVRVSGKALHLNYYSETTKFFVIFVVVLRLLEETKWYQMDRDVPGQVKRQERVV